MAITQNEINHYQAPANLLKNRVILITGAGDGIGRAVAQDCAEFGATVVLLGKTVSKLEKVYDAIVATGAPEPAIYPMDLRGATWEDYQALAKNIEEQLGQLNGLVHNAASVPNLMPFPHIQPQQYQELMTVNLHAPYLMTQACLTLLRKSDDPCVVFSTHKSNKAYWGSFGIAKAGLEGFLDILAHEFDIENQPLRVNGVDAGVVNTNMRRMIYPGEVLSEIPQPKDVTAPYLFFLGPDSKGITGLKHHIEE